MYYRNGFCLLATTDKFFWMLDNFLKMLSQETSPGGGVVLKKLLLLLLLLRKQLKPVAEIYSQK